MRAHDYGIWIRAKYWEGGSRVEKHWKPEEFSFRDLRMKSLRNHWGVDLIKNGKVISSMRDSRYFWIESLPHLNSSQKTTEASLNSKSTAGVQAKLEDIQTQIDDLIDSLTETKQVINHMIANEKQNKAQ